MHQPTLFVVGPYCLKLLIAQLIYIEVLLWYGHYPRMEEKRWSKRELGWGRWDELPSLQYRPNLTSNPVKDSQNEPKKEE